MAVRAGGGENGEEDSFLASSSSSRPALGEETRRGRRWAREIAQAGGWLLLLRPSLPHTAARARHPLPHMLAHLKLPPRPSKHVRKARTCPLAKGEEREALPALPAAGRDEGSGLWTLRTGTRSEEGNWEVRSG